MTSLRRTLIAATGLCLTASFLPLASPVAGAAPTTRSVGTVAWGACGTGSFEAEIGLECGTLTVPMDRRHPEGGQVTLALSRRVHTSPDADYQGIILTNPGGPGGSGTFLPVISFGFPDEVSSTYDWIGFDPRGVGASTPSLSCDPSYLDPVRPQYVPTTRSIERQWLTRAKQYAADCEAAAGALLRHLSSADTVLDMDAIREALGQEKLTYYGYSYGTYLGQLYATRFPERVRRMVLDGNIRPSRVWEKSNLDQDRGFETTIQAWFAWVASYDSVYHLGRTPRAVERAYYRSQNELAADPIGDEIGAAEFNDIVLNVTYSHFYWPYIASGLAAWVNDHDPSGLQGWYGSGDDNFYASYLAVECSDAPWARDWSVWRRENWATSAKAPFATWGNAWFNAPCAFWPVRAGARATVGSTTAPPILLVGQTYDAPTPFAGSLEARRLFPNARLIEVRGGTEHAVTPNGNACVDDQITAYLADGTLTARRHGNRADSVCADLPLPVPNELAAARTRSATGASGPATSATFQRLKLAALGRAAGRA